MSGEIFVVGASRSGTNLVRALLNAHSTLWISAETDYFDDLRPRLPGNGTESRSPATTESDASATSSRFPTAPSGRPAIPRRAVSSARSCAPWPRSSAGRATRTSRPSAGCAPSGTAASMGREDAEARLPDRRPPERLPRGKGRLPRPRPARRGRLVQGLAWGRRAAGVTESPELEADRERTRRSYNPVLMSLLWRGVVRASFDAFERHGPERVRIQRFERLAAEPEAEVQRALRVARAGVRACAARDPGREQLLRHHRRRRLERAGRALAAAALAVRGRDRADRSASRCSPQLGYAPGRRERLASPPRLDLGRTVPFAAARAAVVNRQRLGKATQYSARAPRRPSSRAGLSSRLVLPRRPTRSRARAVG